MTKQKVYLFPFVLFCLVIEQRMFQNKLFQVDNCNIIISVVLV